MKKNLNYYMSLPYKIEIEPIPGKEGGGYVARLPQFGKAGIIGDGETAEEALADLQKNQKLRFERYLKEGIDIPEPEAYQEEFSGRFVVRIPRFLHKELVLSAKQNHVSLNQYVTALLSMNFRSPAGDCIPLP
jgi:predicted HicB family RNase H-like nuclease